MPVRERARCRESAFSRIVLRSACLLRHLRGACTAVEPTSLMSVILDVSNIEYGCGEALPSVLPLLAILSACRFENVESFLLQNQTDLFTNLHTPARLSRRPGIARTVIWRSNRSGALRIASRR